MQTDSRPSPYPGLIAVAGLFTLVAGIVVMILLPDIRLAAWSVLALGALLLFIAFILDFRRVSRALTSSHGRFGAGTTVMVSVFIGITLLVNAISIGNYHRFDLTALAQFTITNQTKDVLSKLKTPVQAYCFFTPADTTGVSSYATNLLNVYQNYSNQLIVNVIDPDQHPDQAKKYGITQYQTVVFESGNHQRLVPPNDIIQTTVPDPQGQVQVIGVEAEHAFTSAIMEVTGQAQKKVYFLTGHDESDITLTSPGGYSVARKVLLDNLYQVDTLDLLKTPGIPADCAALIIASPQKGLSAVEVSTIQSYLISGGWVMVLLDPNPTPELQIMLIGWGLAIPKGTVVDPTSYVIDPSSSTPNQDQVSVPRTRNHFKLTPDTYLPGSAPIFAREITLPQNAGIITPISLIWTSPDAWLDTNHQPGVQAVFNASTDNKSTFSLAELVFFTPAPDTGVSGQAPMAVPPTRLIVIGDSDFATNQHFYNGSNGEFFVQAVDLLTTGANLVSIDRKIMPFRRLVIGQTEMNFISISSLAVLPLIVLITGGIVWWRRR